MTNDRIDFLVNGITTEMNRITDRVAAFSELTSDSLKVTLLIQELGTTSGLLLFLKDELLADKKPERKFRLLRKR